MTDQSPLRRKIGAIRHDVPPLPSVERVWRRAIVHGLSHGLGLSVEAESPVRVPIRPEAAAALMTEFTLAVLLDGAAGPGILLVESGPLAAVIEQKTTGRIGKRPPRPRKPSSTDAALLADPLDRILSTHEAMVKELKLPCAVTGFCYAAPLPTARDILLALPDQTLDHWKAPLSFADDEMRSGAIHLILPTESTAALATAGGAGIPDWSARMEMQVMSSEVTLDARLGRIKLTAADLQSLKPGGLLALPREQVGKVQLIGPGGAVVGTGRLGQTAGRKAVRIEPPQEEDTFYASGPQAAPAGLLM